MGNSRSIIYFTDNRTIDPPIIPVVKKYILEAGLPIVSVSLAPIDFGKNIVLQGRRRGPFTLILQIILGLENSDADNVFFCEHDVLYHKSHFDFTPPQPDIFYYNENLWKWRYHTDVVVRHNGSISLSGLYCNRKLALEHFKLRKQYIEKQDLWDKEMTKEAPWCRFLGYEPGFKPIKSRGYPPEKFEVWNSEFPNVDIRHRFCFSNRKTKLRDFAHRPSTWIESTIDKVPGWDLRKLFNIKKESICNMI